jgi:hypothetical protein
MKNQLGSGRSARLAAAMVTIALAFTVGCDGSSSRFGAMPSVGQQEKADYTTILGPESGSGPKTFSIPARPGLAVWLGCIGKGIVRMTRPMGIVAICHSGNDFAGGLTQPTHYRRGQKLAVRIIGPASVRWEFRIDGAPWTG